MKFGAETYRAGAMERLEDATLLLRNGHSVGAVYAGGLAVEGMLRSLVWLRDRRLDERHDLRRLAVRIDHLGLLRRGGSDLDFVSTVQSVAVRWHNGLRFAAQDQMVRHWTDLGIVPKKRRDSIRAACATFVNECSEAVNRCEVLWQRQQKRSSKRS